MKRLMAGLVVVAVLFSLLPSTAWTNPCSSGDYDCDEDVDFFDYILFSQDFMRGFMDQPPIEPCRACSPFAVNDTAGAGLQLGPLDLATASVVTYDKENPSSIPDFVKVGVKMAAGSHLPGAIFFDFDVDNDSATGGSSIITMIPAFNCGSQPCKIPVGDGFDFFVALALRTQGDTSNLSLASGCIRPGPICATRGVPSGCDEGVCYQLGNPCEIGDPDCYEIEFACTDCPGGPSHYTLDKVCGTTSASCAKPLIKGDYYVGFGQPDAVKVGDINIRNSYDINNEVEICATLPWGLIVTQLWNAINDAANPKHPPFDMSYTVNNPPKYQVSVFYDPVFADGDDLFTLPGLKMDLNDWLPDTARVADGEYNQHDPCL